MDMTAALAGAGAPALPRLPEGAGRDKALKTAREFEEVFLSDALKTMWQGLSTDPLTGGSTGAETWRDLLIDAYAKDFVGRGGLGLAAPIAGDLLKIQENGG